VNVRRLPALLVALFALAAAGCGGSSSSSPSSAASTQSTSTSGQAAYIPWPAPSDPLVRAVRAGLVPEVREQLDYHVHAHLDVFVDGRHVTIPGGIGINISDPGVQSGSYRGQPAYGGISGCSKPCISPLHTHDVTGVLHTESATPKPNRLGQFFVEWGVRLTPTCVGGYCRPAHPIAIYVDGTPFSGDPNGILLKNFREIAIVVGTPPASVPSTFPTA
jgi:hypothetical protein